MCACMYACMHRQIFIYIQVIHSSTKAIVSWKEPQYYTAPSSMCKSSALFLRILLATLVPIAFLIDFSSFRKFGPSSPNGAPSTPARIVCHAQMAQASNGGDSSGGMCPGIQHSKIIVDDSLTKVADRQSLSQYTHDTSSAVCTRHSTSDILCEWDNSKDVACSCFHFHSDQESGILRAQPGARMHAAAHRYAFA